MNLASTISLKTPVSAHSGKLIFNESIAIPAIYMHYNAGHSPANTTSHSSLILKQKQTAEDQCDTKRSLRFRLQEFEQFGAWHEQLAAQHPADFEFAALNEPINAEIIDAKQVSRFLDGIGKPLGLPQRFCGVVGVSNSRRRRAGGGGLAGLCIVLDRLHEASAFTFIVSPAITDWLG